MPIRVAVQKITIRLILWLAATGFFLPGATGQDYRNNQNPYGQNPYGQNPYGQNPYGQNPNGQNPYGNYDPNNPMNLGANPFASGPDTTRKDADTTKRIRKPLESYLFDDSTRVKPSFVWNFDSYRNRIKMTRVDTVMNDFQIDLPFLQKGLGDAYQGKLGGASVPLNYFDRPDYQDFSFAEGFYAYHFTPENVKYYNVKKAFSRFNYLWAGKKKNQEENFAIAHAQNISPSSGFHLDYMSRGTRGIYSNHRGRAKNLSLGFYHTGKKYTVHAGYIYNATLNRENGGVINDDDITTSMEFELPENVPVSLTDARNVIKNNTYYVTQSYGFPMKRVTDEDFSIAKHPTVFIGHTFQYHRWHRNYTDTRTGSEVPYSYVNENNETVTDVHKYYDNWYIHPAETRDSVFESKMVNRVFVQLQPWDRNGVVGTIDAGVGMDKHLYYMFRPEFYLHGKSEVKETSYYVYGSISGKIRRYVDWGGDMIFHPTGYRSGEFKMNGHASFESVLWRVPFFVEGRASYERRAPSFWSEHYYSNHFKWENSFTEENETRIEAKLRMPSIDFEVGFGQSLLKDKIYFGANKLPAQSSGDITVTGMYLQKRFNLGGFHFNHRVLLQWSNNERVVPVPAFSAFLSYYFEFNVVRDVLRVQFGLDGRFNTEYYAPGWNPSASTFYNQREKKLGNYPMVDVFVNAKWKRMRILLKMAHLNEDLLGGSNKNYFSTLHNPYNRRVFKIGISWTFYD